MRLLFDQNLSRTLVGDLRDVFPDSQHVTALSLDTATDREIWEYVHTDAIEAFAISDDEALLVLPALPS